MVLLKSDSQKMTQGFALPPFKLKNYDGKMFSSEDWPKATLLLVIFTCNHCPYAKAAWPVLVDLQDRYASQGLQIVAINPNNNPKYPDDTWEKMAPLVEREQLNFPYLFDADQSVAKLYGAVCTPDPFLFRQELAHEISDNNESPSSYTLYYHGRLNVNWQEPIQVEEKSMELYMEAALGNATPPTQSVPAMGCSIKWLD